MIIIFDIRKEISLGKTIYELPLRVCYYARVSTTQEEQLTSIVNQVDYFIKYIQSYSNWQLVGGYVDEGISGKEVRSRKQFIKMIKDGEMKKFDLILTKSVSRFARNTIDSIYYTNHLLDYGIGVIFLNDNINTFYSDSEFRLTLMASIAQDELRKLSESVRFGLQQSIKRGVVLGNDNMLGYCKERGKLVIVEKEAEIVRDIFYLFINKKYNYSELARVIYFKYQRKMDGTSIKRVLTNHKYKGYYCGKKTEVVDYKKKKRRTIEDSEWLIYRDYEKVPPIVSEDIWECARKLVEKRSRKRNFLGLYDGKIFCLIHKKKLLYRVKRTRNKTYQYYICLGCCSLSSRLLDNIIKNREVFEILLTPGEIIRLDIKCK